jgi:hypothetical protein
LQRVPVLAGKEKPAGKADFFFAPVFRRDDIAMAPSAGGQ